MLLPRSGVIPRPGLVIRDPVLYHEKRATIFLSPFLHFLRFSGGVSPNTRCAANLIFHGKLILPFEWVFIKNSCVVFVFTQIIFLMILLLWGKCAIFLIKLTFHVQSLRYKKISKFIYCGWKLEYTNSILS